SQSQKMGQNALSMPRCCKKSLQKRNTSQETATSHRGARKNLPKAGLDPKIGISFAKSTVRKDHQC
ncbi:MAG: hypothetical protein VX155_01485, partial [Planctomycetota bacterium]|nr:hypothetical protein [Planctomycetota bacterium]